MKYDSRKLEISNRRQKRILNSYLEIQTSTDNNVMDREIPAAKRKDNAFGLKFRIVKSTDFR